MAVVTGALLVSLVIVVVSINGVWSDSSRRYMPLFSEVILPHRLVGKLRRFTSPHHLALSRDRLTLGTLLLDWDCN